MGNAEFNYVNDNIITSNKPITAENAIIERLMGQG